MTTAWNDEMGACAADDCAHPGEPVLRGLSIARVGVGRFHVDCAPSEDRSGPDGVDFRFIEEAE